MPKMAHNYRIIFHRRPLQDEPFFWHQSEPIEVSAMTPETAQRLARKMLMTAPGEEDLWSVRECQDLGSWNTIAQ